MNKYPNYVTKECRPQIFLTGQVETEPDIHDRLIRVFQNSYKDTDSKEQSTVKFKSVPIEQAIPEKKPPKETLSTEGILKYNWPSKHYECVPSVLVFTIAFNIDWTLSEWVRKESWIQDRFNRLKTLTLARDIKIIVTIIKVGLGSTSTSTESIDERLNSLKRHLQLDSRNFHLLSNHDISTNTINMKKISKYIKEYSSQYYINKIKSLKLIEKTITEKYKGIDEHILLTRFYFKIAFYYEFQTQQLQSLRYYRQAYNSLLNCISIIKNYNLFEQIKVIAEIIHYKICNILLLTNSIGEVFIQFKLHIRSFLNTSLYNNNNKNNNNTTTTTIYLFKHYEWISNQYIVFAELLQYFAISDNLPDADRGYYYQNAARYTQKRRDCYEKIKNTTETAATTKTMVGIENRELGEQEEEEGEQCRTSFRGRIILSPRFLGSAMQFEEPMVDTLQQMDDTLLLGEVKDGGGSSSSSSSGSNDGLQNIYTEYLYEQECSVCHSRIIMKLLNLALEMTNYAFIRRRGFLHYLIAEEYMHERQYTNALACLKMASELLCEEGWILPAVTILSLQTKCAILLGRPQEFLDAALDLYINSSNSSSSTSSCGNNVLSRQELEALHLNIFSLFEASLTSHAIDCTIRPYISDNTFTMQKFMIQKQNYMTATSTPLIYRDDYGQAIHSSGMLHPDPDPTLPVSIPIKYCLNADHTINMNMNNNMFDVQVSFGTKVVELGQSILVTLSLTSHFIDTIIFDEMKIYFTDNVVVKTIIGTDKLISEQHQHHHSMRSIVHDHISKNDSTNSLNEKDTHSHEVQVSNTDAIYTSLAFPTRKERTFSFYIYISEPCFNKFTTQDAILCLERVELCWYSQTRRKELNLPEEISMNTTSTDIRSAAIIFNINAFPISLQRAKEEVTLAAGKPQTLKDLVGFCADERFATVTVHKPNALISIVDPLQNVNLLQGVIQRVNVFLRLGQTDVLDGYVYLSSDHQPAGSSDALFWYPDKRTLSGCTSSNTVEDSVLDQVPFHPITLGITMQPEQPVHIPAPTSLNGSSNNSNDDVIICVPLFVKSDSAKTVTISLRVEFIPKGILRSSLSKDFTITTNFLSPFDVRYALGRDGSLYDTENSTLKTGSPSLLTTSLICLNSLQHAIGVVDMEISSSTRRDANTDTTADDDTDSGLRFVTIAHGPQDHARLFHSESPLPLRSQELVTKSIHLQHIPATSAVSSRKVPSFYEQFTAKKDVSSAPGGTIAHSSVISSGHVDVSWRVLQTHILRRPFSSLSALAESPRHGTGGLLAVPADINAVGNINWLLSLGGRERRAEGASESPRAVVSKHHTETPSIDSDNCYLDRSISAFTVCKSTFPLPDIKVADTPFDVTVTAPTSCGLQDLISIAITVHSRQSTLERVRVNVVVNEAFLLTGPTLTVLEVPARGKVNMEVSVMPIRCGTLALPSISLVWDRGINNSLALYEAGKNDPHMQNLFVSPL